MSSYWAGNAGTGMALGQAEFEAFVKRYVELNPHEAGHVDAAIEDAALGELMLLPSYKAGEHVPDLQDGKHGFAMSLVPLSDDFASGAALWPFYRPDGTMNMPCGEDGAPREQAMTPLMPDGNPCYVCWSRKSMSCAAAFAEKPYGSYADFVAEFKWQFGRYLPDDFDWDAHLGVITFASYG